jgi:hypothetical protein
MAGLNLITKKAQAEWRRQLAAIDAGRRRDGAGPVVSPRRGTAIVEAKSEPRSKRNVASRVLAYVSGHPGARLTEMERALRINRIESARTVHALLNRGKIRRDKETRQYFPA